MQNLIIRSSHLAFVKTYHDDLVKVAVVEDRVRRWRGRFNARFHAGLSGNATKPVSNGKSYRIT